MSSVHGIFATDGIDLINAARTGGTVNGVVMRTFGMGRHSLNRHGQIAYFTTLTGNTTLLRLWTPDLRWRSPASGLWAADANWTLSLTPASVHHVFIEPATALTVTGPAADAAVRSLKIGGGAGAAALEWQPGFTLTAAAGVSIAGNGVLAGGGAIAGGTLCEGTLHPKAGAGGLTFTGAASLTATAAVQIELGGAAAADSGRLVCQGDVTLAGALQLSLINGHVPAAGQTYHIVAIGGTRSGMFAGLPEGAVAATLGGRELRISYVGGDGNDLVLTAGGTTPAPLPPPVLTLDPVTGQAHLLVHWFPGQACLVQRSGDLDGWETRLSTIAPADGIVQFTDTSPPATRAFYRGKSP